MEKFPGGVEKVFIVVRNPYKGMKRKHPPVEEIFYNVWDLTVV